MAVWGRFVNNRIVETSTDDPTGIYPPGVTWAELPDYAVKLGYSNFGLDENGKVILVNLREFREIVKNIVADKRWKFQNGYFIDYKGNNYSTDRESCNTLTSAISLGSLVEASQKGVTFETPWKTLTGFVKLGLGDLVNIALLLGQFVNKIFAIESAYQEKIDTEEDPKKIYESIDDINFTRDYEALGK